MGESDKARRGWWASIAYIVLICVLIYFLSTTKIVEENRDILVGIIGMLTGSISSMVAIASGRDPSEIGDLKDKLATANADRQALIERLRDAQIQMQLLRDQVFELQTAVIEKLSLFAGTEVIKTKSAEEVRLKEVVDEWTPKKEEPKKVETKKGK